MRRLVCLFCLANVALAQRDLKMDVRRERVALVVGNANYLDSPLKNAVNDARDMSRVCENWISALSS